MENHILGVAEALTKRITQERVRQMHFLAPNQYIALHFKVTAEDELHFIYASIIPEREVIIQTRHQLLMEDPCMTDIVPGAALIPGGTMKKMQPYKTERPRKKEEIEDEEEQDAPFRPHSAREPPRAGSMPPPRESRSAGWVPGSGSQLPPIHRGGNVEKDPIYFDRNPLTERRLLRKRNKIDAFIPQVATSEPPLVPPAPYSLNHLPHENEEAGRFEYPPPFIGMDTIKHPLISFPPPPSGSESFSARG
jgi:hypothetical protein